MALGSNLFILDLLAYDRFRGNDQSERSNLPQDYLAI